MTPFIITASLMLLAGLLFFLPALRGRNTRTESHEGRARLNLELHQHRQGEFERENLAPEILARLTAESERNLLGDLETTTPGTLKSATTGRAVLAGALTLAIIATVGAYTLSGRPDLIGKAPPPSLAETRDAVHHLAEQLGENPNDLAGWIKLGQALETIEEPKQAAQAFEFASRLAPDNLDLKIHLAQNLAEASQGAMTGKPEAMVLEILRQDPAHKNALWLAGIAAAQRQDNPTARKYWEQLRAQFADNSPEARELTDYINRLQAPEQAQAQPQQASRASIRVKVTLADTLKSKAASTDTVFIFVRAAEGPPMPLAVVRKQVSDLPAEVVLDDSMAMRPGMSLSSFEKVVVGARVSKQGQPTASPGDLQGFTSPLKPERNARARVDINQIVEAR